MNSEPMIQSIAAYEGRLAKVQGPARSGKTEALVQRAARLLAGGVAPERIFVETTSAIAADALTRRLAHAAAAAGVDARTAARVRIARALDECARVLDAPEARRATGRVPRMLAPFEHNFLLEDMKTLGQPRRRLRKMLDAFYSHWADGDPESSWLLPGSEEAITCDHLRDTLIARNAMIAEEIPFVCATYLQSPEGALACGCYDYVLADDFQNLSRAEQTCLCLLAREQIIVAGNENECVATASRYPAPDHFAKFESLRRNVAVFELETAHGSASIQRFADELAGADAMNAHLRARSFDDGPGNAANARHAAGGSADESDDVLSVKWADPQDELNGLTKYLRALANANPDAHENRTCIVVPNRRWAHAACRMLRTRGFDVSVAAAGTCIGGDPRDLTRSHALQAYTKLNLIAHPDDLTAWRSWCGFGHALTNSDAWAGLVAYARETGTDLLAALMRCASAFERGEQPPFLRADALAKRVIEGRRAIAAGTGRRGHALLRAIGAKELPEFFEVASRLDGDEDACALYDLMRRHVCDPSFSDNPHALHLTSMEALAGTAYDTVVVFGAIDGFIPRRDAYEVVSTDEERARVMNADRRAFYTAVSKAASLLVISSFSTAPLELAEQTKMQVARVRSENDERIALVRPSAFLADAGAACPSTVGGQALLASRSLN